MSKSLGNSPDPIDLMKKYSADGVRVGMLLCSPAGNDLLFEESLTEQGRNFSNKIWNAFRLIKSWEVDPGLEQPAHAREAVSWFDSLLNRSIKKLDQQFDRYRISDALMILYRLFWDEFSSWYLESVKPAYEKPIDRETYQHTLSFFDRLLHLLHPFMPFITEEIWQLLEERESGQSLMVSPMPSKQSYDKALLEDFEDLKAVVTNIRSIRKDKDISPRDALNLMVRSAETGSYHSFLEDLVIKLANLSGVDQVDEDPGDTVSFIVKNVEYFIPVGNLVNPEEEAARLKADLEYTRGFLASVRKKLENERFVSNAPEAVVGKERQKAADAEARIKVLEAQLAKLEV
jgi:valyl-tRNA synthetase